MPKYQFSPFAKNRIKPQLFEFPYGGRTLAGEYRFVAIYGSPGNKALGVLGEQSIKKSIVRVKDIAVAYQELSQEPIYPSLEIISTIASAAPTENGDYSQEVDPKVIKDWVEAAKIAGVYVILDLQPGRTDFLTQAKMYRELLSQPNVGLALDPEWRLKPNQVHLKQIGSVDIKEVNKTATWLADLTKSNDLPQKLFLLHQFRFDMISGRERLDTSRSELAYVIQMDGQGSQGSKKATYGAIVQDPPKNVYFGWKNFYKKDSPVLSPNGTMLIKPIPWYISYQ